MTEAYHAHKWFLKQNIGKVVVFNEIEERMMLSPHRHPKEHETVVEAAFWVRTDRPKGASKYKTYIRRGLGGMGGGTSIVNDGSYADSREEAIDWLEDTAQEFDGSPLNWDSRPREYVTTEELLEE